MTAAASSAAEDTDSPTNEPRRTAADGVPPPIQGTAVPPNLPRKGRKAPRKKQVANRARHRLWSILRDAAAVATNLPATLSERFGSSSSSWESWPLVANERCGSWYAPPRSANDHAGIARFASTCCFKSTDGHEGTWNVSLKRLNLHLVDLCADHGGCLLVDSSVRKLLPDSFARTIPIWACALNRIVRKYRGDDGAEDDGSWDTDLHVPPELVPPEECNEICGVMEDRVETLFRSRAIVDPDRLVRTLTKPLRPVWISNGCRKVLSHGDTDLRDLADRYFLLVCVNPSTYHWRDDQPSKNQIQWIPIPPPGNVHTGEEPRVPSGSEPPATPTVGPQGYYYTSGAGDDEESWARRLTPALFWEHCSGLTNPLLLDDDDDDDEVDQHIDALVSLAAGNDDDGAGCRWDTAADRIGSLPVWIGSRRAGRPPECWNRFDAILNVTDQEYPGMMEEEEKEGHPSSGSRFYLQLPVAEGKRDRTELERWMPVGLLFLIRHLQQGRRILVHCNQGKDRSVAMVLALVIALCPRPLVFPLQLSTRLDECSFRLRLEDQDQDDADPNDGDEWYLSSGISRRTVESLLEPTGKEAFLLWVHSGFRESVSLVKTPRALQPLANKDTLRIALHLLRQDREVADPSRSTMQKLNRFFMSSKLYIGDKERQNI